MGQEEEEEVGEPGLLRPEGGDQSHGEIWGLSDSGHHPVDQIERWELVDVEMILRVAEGVFEDGLRVWNQCAIQGKLRIEVCCEEVDRRGSPGEDDLLRHLWEQGPLCR